MSDYDRPSAPPHILANALSDPIDLPPGRGRAAQSARVSAPSLWVVICRACGAMPNWWMGCTKAQIIRDLKQEGWTVTSRRKPMYCPDCTSGEIRVVSLTPDTEEVG